MSDKRYWECMAVQRDLTPLPREERLSGKIKGRSEINSRGFQKHPTMKRTMSGKVVPR